MASALSAVLSDIAVLLMTAAEAVFMRAPTVKRIVCLAAGVSGGLQQLWLFAAVAFTVSFLMFPLSL